MFKSDPGGDLGGVREVKIGAWSRLGGGSGGQMRPFVDLVDPPLGTVLVFKTGYFPNFVVRLEAYFFEGLSDPFGD